MSSMLLLKDKSIHLCKKSSKLKSYLRENFEDCKYIMVPIDDDNNTFVLSKVKPYMKHFQKAKISYQLAVIDYNGFEGSEDYKELERVDIEVCNVDDLLSTLHSLNRIRYYNKVANSNETPKFSLFEFIYFHLDVTCKHDKTSSTVFNETIVGSKSNRFSVHEIFELIKEIYNPIAKFPKNNKFLSINDTDWKNDAEWKLSKYISDDDYIIGFILPCSKSLSFTTKEFYNKITSSIRSVFCSAITYNPEETTDIMNDLAISIEQHDQTVDMRYHDLWTHNICDIIEYINYVQYISMNSIFVSEIFAYGEMKNKMIMETQLILSKFTSKGKNEELIYDFKHNELTLSKFYEIIMTLDI